MFFHTYLRQLSLIGGHEQTISTPFVYLFFQIFPDFPAGEVNVSLTYEKSTSRLKVHVVKARNLCCKALEGKKQDRCGVSCSGDLAVITQNHLG